MKNNIITERVHVPKTGDSVISCVHAAYTKIMGKPSENTDHIRGNTDISITPQTTQTGINPQITSHVVIGGDFPVICGDFSEIALPFLDLPDNVIEVNFPEMSDFSFQILFDSPVIYIATVQSTMSQIEYVSLGDGVNFFVYEFRDLIDYAKPVIDLLSQKTIVGYDLKPTLKYLVSQFKADWKADCLPKRCIDIKILSQLLWYAKSATLPKDSDLSLPQLARKYSHIDLLVLDSDELRLSWRYSKEQIQCANRCFILPRLEKALNDELRDIDYQDLPIVIESFCSSDIVKIELAGMPINREELEPIKQEATERMEKHRKWLKEAGLHNPNSADEALKFLRSKGIRPESVRKEDLKRFPDNLAVRNYLEYGASKYIAGYIESVLKAGDDRIFPNFDQVGAASGRMSSHSPNVQGIPQEIQDIFYKAPMGRAIIHADYPAIDLRSAAIIAQDEVLIECFKAGGDPHKIMAAKLSGKPVDEIEKDSPERKCGKIINLGFLYGMGADTFISNARKYDAEYSTEEAEDFKRKYFEAFPGIKGWHEKTKEQLKYSTEKLPERDGWEKVITVQTLAGRIMKAVGLSKALNYQVQGTSADIMKIAMNLFHYICREINLDANIINVIHDAVDVECATDQLEDVKAALKEAMEQAANIILRQFKTVVEVE